MNNNIAETIGFWIGIGGVISIVIWIIWALYKYKPFSHFAQVMYDLRLFVVEVVLMYSNKPSKFSIKRFHNGLITYWALITASLFIRHNTMTAAELMIIIGPFLGKGIYDVYQSQQDKKMDLSKEESKEEEQK